MGATTSIEWAANADGSPGATWNPVRARNRETGAVGTHCVHASEGCRFCYAETFNLRGLPGAGTGLAYTKPNEARVDIFLDEKMLIAPLRKRKPTTWFLSSMTDVFADFVSDAMLDRLFAVMALCPQHTFIVLTKRSSRMRTYLSPLATGFRWLSAIRAIAPPSAGHGVGLNTKNGALPNVWLGVSAEDQKTADERIPDLLATPAAIRLLSAEPLLGPIDLRRIVISAAHTANVLTGDLWQRLDNRTSVTVDAPRHMQTRLDWVIVGGESGRDARPMHPDWARLLRDQCALGGVPFFFKQWGEYRPEMRPDMRVIEMRRGHVAWPDGTIGPGRALAHGGPGVLINRHGKKLAGRQFDGVEHDARPELARRSNG